MTRQLHRGSNGAEQQKTKTDTNSTNFRESVRFLILTTMARSGEQEQRKQPAQPTKRRAGRKFKKRSKKDRALEKIGDFNAEGKESPFPTASEEEKRASRSEDPIYMEPDDPPPSPTEEERKGAFLSDDDENVAVAARATRGNGGDDNEDDETISDDDNERKKKAIRPDRDETEHIDDSDYVIDPFGESNVKLTTVATFDLVRRQVNFKTATSDQQKEAAKQLFRNKTCRAQFLKATKIFRYQVSPNVKSGGKGGSTFGGNHVTFVASDIHKISATRFDVHEKKLVDFRGYHMANVKIGNEVRLQVRRVSATVRILPAVSGDVLSQSDYEKAVCEGYGQIHIRWADVRDVWNDYEYSKKLIKYFIGMSLHQAFWKPTYDLYWPKMGGTQDPINDLQWAAKEEL